MTPRISKEKKRVQPQTRETFAGSRTVVAAGGPQVQPALSRYMNDNTIIMDKRYSTIIFTPRDGRRFMKLKVSHRLIFSLVSLVISSLMLSLFFTVEYYRSVQQAEFYTNATKASRALEEELVAANAQMVRSMRNIETASAQLVQQRRESERRLEELRHRYESLRALADGQEKIAAAHRAILEHRPLRQRLWEQATAFLVGVLSSLVATFVWVLAKSRTMNRNEDGLDVIDM